MYDDRGIVSLSVSVLPSAAVPWRYSSERDLVLVLASAADAMVADVVIVMGKEYVVDAIIQRVFPRAERRSVVLLLLLLHDSKSPWSSYC